MRQEQERAQPDVVEVARGVLRMQLPIELPGLGHVNMYALVDDRGLVVIDPGLPTDVSWDALRERLRAADYDVRHIHTVVVTHSHADHYGGAARIHAETGCRVIGHQNFSAFGECHYRPHLEVSVEHLETDEPADGAQPEPVPDDRARNQVVPGWLRDPGLPRGLAPWGGKLPEISAVERNLWERSQLMPALAIVPRLTHTVRHGSRVSLAGRDWFVWHTPGHTADHVCLYDPDQGTFLSGDHVLPSITPHISGTSMIPDSLRAFFDSLDRVLEVGPVAQCLPAHGHPFADLASRAQAIKLHHVERLERIKDIGRRLGTATVAQYASELFHPRNQGYMAQSEAYAHLEHLRLRNEVERRQSADGEATYTV